MEVGIGFHNNCNRWLLIVGDQYSIDSMGTKAFQNYCN